MKIDMIERNIPWCLRQSAGVGKNFLYDDGKGAYQAPVKTWSKKNYSQEQLQRLRTSLGGKDNGPVEISQ